MPKLLNNFFEKIACAMKADMPHSKAILFDYDGVLADTLPFSLYRWTETARIFGNGRQVTREFVLSNPTGAWQNFYIEQLGVPEEKIELASRLFLELAQKDGAPSLFNGIIETIQSLSVDHDLYVLSGNYSEVIRTTLTHHNLSDFFIDVAGHTEVGGAKKIEPLFYESSLQRWGLEKESVVYIGDTADEVIGSQKAGIKTISCSWGYQSRQSLEEVRPDVIIDEPSQISSAVARVFEDTSKTVNESPKDIRVR